MKIMTKQRVIGAFAIAFALVASSQNAIAVQQRTYAGSFCYAEEPSEEDGLSRYSGGLQVRDADTWVNCPFIDNIPDSSAQISAGVRFSQPYRSNPPVACYLYNRARDGSNLTAGRRAAASYYVTNSALGVFGPSASLPWGAAYLSCFLPKGAFIYNYVLTE